MKPQRQWQGFTQGDLEWVRRVRNLILLGRIRSAAEIPDGAIPADPSATDVLAQIYERAGTPEAIIEDPTLKDDNAGVDEDPAQEDAGGAPVTA